MFLKEEVHILFDQFHGNECISNYFLSYFITLIPNIRSPFAILDLQLILLLVCLYKLLAKVLMVRLAIKF